MMAAIFNAVDPHTIVKSDGAGVKLFSGNSERSNVRDRTGRSGMCFLGCYQCRYACIGGAKGKLE